MKAGGKKTLEQIIARERLPDFEEFFSIFPSVASCTELLLKSSPLYREQCSSLRTNCHQWVHRSPRNMYCRCCYKSVWPTEGTVFANCNVDLRMFFFAMLSFCHSRRLISAGQISDLLRISHNSAVKLRNKVWSRLIRVAPTGLIGGPGRAVEVDELLVSRHIRRRRTAHRFNAFGITDRKTFRVFLLPDRKRATLWPVIAANVAPGSLINTDGWRAYRRLELLGYEHVWCNHSKGIFLGSDGATTATLDGYWGELKRSLVRTHHGISQVAAPAFLAAHAARHTYREHSAWLFWEIIGCDPAHLVACALDDRSAGRDKSPVEPLVAAHPLHVISDEKQALGAITALIMGRDHVCAYSGTPTVLQNLSVDGRWRCAKCRRSSSLLKLTVIGNTKIPLRCWLALIWLMTQCRDGVSIHYAAQFLGVSRPAAIAMQQLIRSEMAGHLANRTMGGSGITVHLALARVRVRSPEGRPRCRHRTVIVAFDGCGYITDVLPERSRTYVRLWVKKHIVAGTSLRCPDTIPFHGLADLPLKCTLIAHPDALRSPCRGVLAVVKAWISRYHHAVPFERLAVYLKEIEFRRLYRGRRFEELAQIILIPATPAACQVTRVRG